MKLKKNLWVFGDSFSVPFEKMIDDHPYIPYKGYCPKIFSILLSEKFDFRLRDCARGGSSNYDIFHTFIKNIDNILEDDIIIFGWTQTIRFRVANKNNDFYDVIIAVVDKMIEFHGVPCNSLIDISDNRAKSSVYFDELYDFIKIIEKSKPNCKILHWTWVEPYFKDRYEKRFYDLLIPYKKYKTVKEETNENVNDFHYGELGHYELYEELSKFL